MPKLFSLVRVWAASHGKAAGWLLKPRITMLCMAMAAAGLALGGWPGLVPGVCLLGAVGLSVGGANAWNMVLERDRDGLMVRTRQRPLPAGLLPLWAACVWASLAVVLSSALLWRLSGTMACALGLGSLALYCAAYTPLKERTPVALYVGAIPGAVPPLLGWVLARGHLSFPAVALFLIVFFWQIPHFLAISVRNAPDYAAGGVRTYAETASAGALRVHAGVTALLTLGSSLLLPLSPSAAQFYVPLALGLGGWFTYLAVRPGASPQAWARSLFLGSLAYLPILMGGAVLVHLLFPS